MQSGLRDALTAGCRNAAAPASRSATTSIARLGDSAYIQRPDRWLETPGFAPYLQAVSLETTNLTRAWRAVRCLTTGLRIPISLSGNSTSSTARVRPVDE